MVGEGGGGENQLLVESALFNILDMRFETVESQFHEFGNQRVADDGDFGPVGNVPLGDFVYRGEILPDALP